MRMPAELLAHVAIEPQKMEEIISLEDAVMLDHPVMLLRDKGLHDGRRNVRMIVRAQRVADVVQQRTAHVFLVAARLVGAGRGLQAMLQAVDRKAAMVAAKQVEMRDEALWQPLREALQLASDQLPVLERAFGDCL